MRSLRAAGLYEPIFLDEADDPAFKALSSESTGLPRNSDEAKLLVADTRAGSKQISLTELAACKLKTRVVVSAVGVILEADSSSPCFASASFSKKALLRSLLEALVGDGILKFMVSKLMRSFSAFLVLLGFKRM